MGSELRMERRFIRNKVLKPQSTFLLPVLSSPDPRSIVEATTADLYLGAKNDMQENELSSTSKADSDEKTGEFWDSHDFTEFDTGAPDADFVITPTVRVSIELLSEIEKASSKARLKGGRVGESLVASET